MNARILPKEEYHRLEEANGLPQIAPTMPDGDAKVIVIEDDGRIVGTMGVFRVTHFESLWIAPEYRGNPALASKLLDKCFGEARSHGVRWAWGASDSDRMDELIPRVGGKEMKVKSYMIPVGIEGEVCPRQ